MQEVDLAHPIKIESSKLNGLDINKTFDCGQCFRWNVSPPNQWCGVINGKVYWMAKILNNDTNESSLITSASFEEWDTELSKYLDIYGDYTTSIPSNDSFALKAQEYGKGIKILNQDPWETLISFIISQRNNIPKIKSTVERLCEKFGEPIDIEYKHKTVSDKKRFYAFPTAEKLSKLKLSELQGLGLGYRDEYILLAAKAIANGEINLEKLKDTSISGYAAIDELQRLKGVGPKVANCVALFGLHKLDTFPIDVWIQRMIDRYYDGNLNPQVYGNKVGLVQQYMFFYMRNQ